VANVQHGPIYTGKRAGNGKISTTPTDISLVLQQDLAYRASLLSHIKGSRFSY